uniref:CARD domain-containing protein n=1 Tax=Plectus sambesii TaxID=2011161 RepID=A0A914VV53_9BILA
MNELKQEAIKNHYANLVECMDPWRVVDHLAKLLSLEEMELIRKAQLTSEERNRELIAILFKKNEDLGPFERFIKALEETDKRHETMAKAILKIYKHDNGAAESEKVPSTSLSDAGETKYRCYTFNSHNHGGRNVSGRVSGKNVTIVQGDYYASGQAPSTSSSTPSQPSAEDWQQTLVK